MKRILTAFMLAIAGILTAVSTTPEKAFGRVVYDPWNYGKNVLTAARTLRQINNQVRQIQNEIRMLQNQARNLQQLPNSIANEIRTKLLAVDSLVRQAQGITNQVSQMKAQYERLYAGDYKSAAPTAKKIISDAEAAWRQSRNGYYHSLQVQAGVVQNVRSDITQLNSLVDQSQGAVGNLQAMQAGNQIQALTATQLMQLQSMIAANQRADALRQSELLAEKERAKQRFKLFMGDGDAGS